MSDVDSPLTPDPHENDSPRPHSHDASPADVPEDHAIETGSGPARVAKPRKCPFCRSVLDQNAVICIQCGYDLRTQRPVQPSSVRKKKRRTAPLKRNALEPLAQYSPQLSWSKAILSLAMLLSGPLLFYGAALSTGVIRSSGGHTDFLPVAIVGILLFLLSPVFAFAHFVHSVKFLSKEPVRAISGVLLSLLLILLAATGWYLGPMKGKPQDLRQRVAQFFSRKPDSTAWQQDFDALLANIPPAEAHLSETDIRNGQSYTNLFGQLQDGAEVTYTTTMTSFNDVEGPEISPGSTIQNGAPVLVVIGEKDHAAWASIPPGTIVRYRGNLELKADFISENGRVRAVRAVIVHVNEILDPAQTQRPETARTAAFQAIVACRKAADQLRANTDVDRPSNWHILLGKADGPAAGSKCLQTAIEPRITPPVPDSDLAKDLTESGIEHRSRQWTDANNLRLAAALNLAADLEENHRSILQDAVIDLLCSKPKERGPITSAEDADKQFKEILSGLGRTPEPFSNALLGELLKALPPESSLAILSEVSENSPHLNRTLLQLGEDWAESALLAANESESDPVLDSWHILRDRLRMLLYGSK